MSSINKPERATQDRVIALFTEQLGYRYLGNWADRAGNHCVEEGLLAAHLERSGYSAAHISATLHRLRSEALLHGRTLYAANEAVYQLLRYGVSVRVEAGADTETVHLVNWNQPAENDFAIAEEVTLKGGHERRPDIVLYLNGIAVGVLELKNSRVGLGEGIRQCLSNQQPEFNNWFFSTIQLVMAGNDSEGLRYGTIETQEKYFLTWKEDEADNAGYKLDKYLAKLCGKARLLELVHDFVLFDGGIKKLPRVHQYFGIKAAQAHVQQRRGGIIWHTQGAGKSILMVLLARWILENKPAARVAIITDRDELDRQIERVFKDAGETIHRSQSGRDLMAQLAQPNPRLLCSLVHKFGRRDVDDFEAFLRDLAAQPSPTQGEIYVFVDECHRTQGGKLHRLMKAMLTDPAYFAKMSALLDEIIRLRKEKAIEYEDYLARIAEVAKKVSAGKADDTPQQVKTAGQLALYNNLKDHVATDAAQQPDVPWGDTSGVLDTAMLLDAAIKAKRPDGWRGVVAKEQMVKQAMFDVLKDIKEVNRLFPIVFAQKEY